MHICPFMQICYNKKMFNCIRINKVNRTKGTNVVIRNHFIVVCFSRIYFFIFNHKWRFTILHCLSLWLQNTVTYWKLLFETFYNNAFSTFYHSRGVLSLFLCLSGLFVVLLIFRAYLFHYFKYCKIIGFWKYQRHKRTRGIILSNQTMLL